ESDTCRVSRARSDSREQTQQGGSERNDRLADWHPGLLSRRWCWRARRTAADPHQSVGRAGAASGTRLAKQARECERAECDDQAARYAIDPQHPARVEAAAQET